MEIKNKTIIVTGAARIGQTIARLLEERGANLALSYLKDKAEAGAFGFPVQADLSQIKDVARLVAETKKRFGAIDAVIHMAAIYQKSSWQDLNEADFERNIDVIAKSAFLLGKIAGDQILKNQGDLKGKMIFFSDWSVLTRPYTEYLAYNMAKSAVVGLVKSIAKELAPHILVNAIAPGPILRPPDLSEDENKEVLSRTLLKRWGGADEIAKGVMYLLDADFVTGQVLTIDGGRTIA